MEQLYKYTVTFPDDKELIIHGTMMEIDKNDATLRIFDGEEVVASIKQYKSCVRIATD